MKITPHKKSSVKILAFTITIIFFNIHPSLAWDGMDVKQNSTITIETGNLVREGSIIDFFDSVDGNYHTGKVLMMNSVSHGTELTIEDFTNKHKERLFLMRD